MLILSVQGTESSVQTPASAVDNHTVPALPLPLQDNDTKQLPVTRCREAGNTMFRTNMGCLQVHTGYAGCRGAARSCQKRRE